MVQATYRIIFIITSITIAFSGTAFGKTEFTVEPHLGILSGYTKYHISGTDFDSSIGNYSWASELEWPVNSELLGATAAVAVNNGLTLEGTVRKNLEKDSGKMKDSDWLNNVLIIYSESDTEMKMLDLDIRGRLIIPHSKNTNISLIAGYRYQDFSFDASNVVQQSVNPGLNGKVLGLVGKYDAIYSIPYLGFGFSSKVRERTVVELSAQLGFVNVTDEDDHVLRYKKSTGVSNGNSVGVSGNLVYDLSRDAFIRLNSEYLFIQATGRQTQRWYKTTSEATQGTTIQDIDLKIESFQALTTIGVGLRF